MGRGLTAAAAVAVVAAGHGRAPGRGRKGHISVGSRDLEADSCGG